MSNFLISATRAAFATQFGGEPTALGLAPGRVELLGNHTDYNGGLVLAAAIDRFTAVVGRPIQERTARVFSANFDELDTFSVDSTEPGTPGSWQRYVRGVCRAIQEPSRPLANGFEAVILGNVPLGAGLSSSASLEAAVALFLIEVGQQGNPNHPDDQARMELAHTLRRAENEYVGVASGLLDQFSCLFGKADHALLLDCQSLNHERLPLGDPAPSIVICDSKTSRKLSDGMYNIRFEECKRVLTYFQQHPGSKVYESLCNITLDDFQTAWKDLDPVGRRRARHVLTEHVRVREGAKALKAGELKTLGRMMSASQRSSREDFENSSEALNLLIEIAEHSPGHLGGKLTGAGWAGCTAHLVSSELADDFAESMKAQYTQCLGIEPAVHICRAAEGAIRQALIPGGCPEPSSALVKSRAT